MQGKWISTSPDVETALFQKSFKLEALPENAEISITGLGYFTLLVNGKRVTEDLFTPAQTNYSYRDTTRFILPVADRLSYRVLYLTYDIRALLTLGENKLEVIVGNGFWRQDMRVAEGHTGYCDRLIACFSLKLDDEIISTDGSEKAFRYPILRSNIYYGEILDTRMFDEPLEEVPLELYPFEPQLLEEQDCTPDRVVRKISPIEFAPNAYDCKENITGWLKLTLKGNRGDVVKVDFAEEYANDRLNHRTYSPPWCVSPSGEQQIQSDTFILNGETQVLFPMFVYHGFRYFTIDCPITVEIYNLEVEVIHTDLKARTTFSCDNKVINWIYEAFIRTQLDNSHGCIPSDCPTRERLGYTGDGQVCCPAVATLFDAKAYYKKWLKDIFDCQDTVSGRIQYTAPFLGGGGGPGGWSSAIILVPFYCYNAYGDLEFLKEAYPKMKKWIECMLELSDDDLLTRGDHKWCLGDWCTPQPEIIPEPFVNSCYLIKQMEYMNLISKALNIDEGSYFDDIAKRYADAIYKNYYKNGRYLYGVQGADAFAIWANLPYAEDCYDIMITKYEKLGYFDTGIFGTYILIDLLFKRGRGDLAQRLLASEVPNYSFGSMMNNDQTTLGERFDGGGSHNHPMFGAVSEFLIKGILGIKQNKFYNDCLIFQPSLNGIVKRAKGSMQTEFGLAAIEFNITDSEAQVDILCPEGIEAFFLYEDKRIPLKAGANHFKL